MTENPSPGPDSADPDNPELHGDGVHEAEPDTDLTDLEDDPAASPKDEELKRFKGG